MKYLFWLVVIVFAWWVYKRVKAPGTGQGPAAPPSTQETVSCAHCGIHLPHDEAVAGLRGQYCSTAHRSAANDRNPD